MANETGYPFPGQGSLQNTPATLRPDSNMTDDDVAQEALDVVASLKQEFKERDDLYERIDRVIFLENAVSIPRAYQKTAIETRSPLPIHITNTVTAALSINPPTVRFNPIGIGDAADENAALRKHFFEASWLRQEQEANRRLFRLFMHALVTKGEGIIKTIERKNRAWAGYGRESKKLQASLDADTVLDQPSKDRIYDMKTEEMKRGMPYPLTSTDIMPESFYYLKGEDGFSVCAEEKQVPYFDVLQKYGASLDSKGKVVKGRGVGDLVGLPRNQWSQVMGNRRMLRMIEVWDWETVTYVLAGPGDMPVDGSGRPGSGQLVKRLKHGYGDKDLKTLKGPYFHAHGVTTSSREIAKQGLSVLFGYLHLFPLLDSLLTIQSQAAYTFGFPAYKRTDPPAFGLPDQPFGIDSEENQAQEQEIVPGMIFPYNIEALAQPKGGVDLDKAIALVRSLLEMALPSAAQGLIGGGDSGYAINQAAHLARLAWQPIVDNAEFAMAQRVAFESMLIEKRIGETVYVFNESDRGRAIGPSSRRFGKGWLGIGPNDLNGVHRYTVKLDPETPSNLTIELRTHRELLDMRLESPRQAIEAVGNDPVQVEREWLLSELKNDPAIRAQMKQAVFKQLATIDQQKMADTPAPSGAPDTGQIALSPQPQVAPGVAPGITPEAYVNAAPAGPPPTMPLQTAPRPSNGTPGTAAGMPGGVRNPPGAHLPLPGE